MKQSKTSVEPVLLVAGEGGEALKAIAFLSEGGFLPLLASDLERGVELCTKEGTKVVLLDLGLQGLAEAQVRDFVAQCRKSGQPSVLGLVPEDKSSHVNFALDLEDFLLLPLRKQELLLRVKHALWRKRAFVDSKHALQFGDLVIDTERYEVTVGNRRLDLTYKEYELLKYLATHPGRVFTREELLSKVWGYDYFGGTRTVDVHIRRLRSKLEDATHAYLDTVRNVGYGFKSRDEIVR